MSIHFWGKDRQKVEKETGTKIILRNVRFFRGGGLGKKEVAFN